MMEKKEHRVIPLLRIFDLSKAIEFYIGWLGFSIDWEHRFGENFPVYMQVSLGNITLHLTEHHGDCCPGGKVYIEYAGELTVYYNLLQEKDYRYMKPGLEKAPWNALTMEVIDPFGNKLLFAEDLKK
ncbi:MAG: glyoxalase superfamily protein [Chitinophagaceae bacterium]